VDEVSRHPVAVVHSSRASLTALRWRCSNNSVFAELGMDYSSVCERVVRNGEPGAVSLRARDARSADHCLANAPTVARVWCGSGWWRLQALRGW
jgi:hypothetical protein